MTTTWTLNFSGDNGGTVYFDIGDTPVAGSTTNYLITGVSGSLGGVTLSTLATVGSKLIGFYTVRNQVKTGGLPSYVGVKDASGNSYLLHTASDGTVSFSKDGDVLNFNKTYSSPTATQSDPFITGTTGADNLIGADNINDSIKGGLGNDRISGLALSDTLEGGDGNDTIDGGEDNDLVYGGVGNDTIIAGAGNDTLYGDGGYDTVQFSGTYADYSFDYREFVSGDGNSSSQQYLYVTFNRNSSNAALTDSGRDYLKTIEYLSFKSSYSSNAFTTYTLYQGAVGRDAFEGTAGQDLMFAGSGNDFLDGKAGADILNGGSGDDTYFVDNIGDITEDASGTDIVNATVSYTLLSGIENLTLTGTSNINATGNALDNTITGNTGNNSINGGAGNDVIDGKSGTDTLVLSGASTDAYIISYAATSSGGTFNVRLGTEVDSLQNVESIYFAADKASMSLIGGTTGNDSLVGTAGGDYIVADAGNDTINGGAGIDRMIGGTGNDTYIVDVTSDTVEEADNQGTDTVQSSASYLLASNIENLTLTGTGNIQGTGNRQGNIITGYAGGNVIDGGVGNDTIDGGAGNDTIAWSVGYDSIEGGLGMDTVRFSSTLSRYTIFYSVSTQRLTVNAYDAMTDSYNYEDVFIDTKIIHGVEKLTFRPAAGATSGTYNLVLATTDRASLTGTAAMDMLFGSLEGDTLNGGAGADVLYGYAGDDTYYIDNAGDTIVETFGHGDQVISTISYALTYSIENLTLSGATHINGTGNDSANTLQGNTGNNTLSGLGGHDTIIGGSGQDTLTGGAGNDIFKFIATADSTTSKNDTITDFVRGTDKIDLSAIDANTKVASDQAFNFILDMAFSREAGQLRFANGVLQGDVNGDGTADFQIAVTGLTTLDATNFVL